MQQLLSIETVPISIEYSTARRESKSTFGSVSSSAKLNISKNDRQLTIRSNPINIQLGEKFKQNAWQNLSYTATAEYTDHILSMNIRIHPSGDAADLSDMNPIRFRAAGKSIDRMVNAVPKSTDHASLFQSMKINFNMAMTTESKQIASGVEASFIPPEIQMDIVEHPKVVIKYIGGPIYFPRSSDPNYVPPVDEAAFETKV